MATQQQPFQCLCSPDQLVFTSATSSIRLLNPYNYTIGYSVHSTNPGAFMVSGPKGTLPGKKKVEIRFILKEMLTSDSQIYFKISTFPYEDPSTKAEKVIPVRLNLSGPLEPPLSPSSSFTPETPVVIGERETQVAQQQQQQQQQESAQQQQNFAPQQQDNSPPQQDDSPQQQDNSTTSTPSAFLSPSNRDAGENVGGGEGKEKESGGGGGGGGGGEARGNGGEGGGREKKGSSISLWSLIPVILILSLVCFLLSPHLPEEGVDFEDFEWDPLATKLLLFVLGFLAKCFV